MTHPESFAQRCIPVPRPVDHNDLDIFPRIEFYARRARACCLELLIMSFMVYENQSRRSWRVKPAGNGSLGREPLLLAVPVGTAVGRTEVRRLVGIAASRDERAAAIGISLGAAAAEVGTAAAEVAGEVTDVEATAAAEEIDEGDGAAAAEELSTSADPDPEPMVKSRQDS